MTIRHDAGNERCAIPCNDMLTMHTSIQEIRSMPKGRKRTALHNEILHHINLCETSLTRFLRGYLAAALGTSTDNHGDTLDQHHCIADIATTSLASAWAECSRFQREYATDLCHHDDERNGHNFWLTRNHHGSSGFREEALDFESSDYESAQLAMRQLTYASETFGEVDLYLGDDQKLHFSNERSVA